MTNHPILALAAMTVMGSGLRAQSPTQAPLQSTTDATNGTIAGCPGGNGIHISATSGTPSDSSSGLNQVIPIGQSVDTTLVFDITSKTWTRTNLAAAISVGFADESRGRYAVCAGVSALLPNVTLTMRGARGRVHFVASLKDFNDALRLGPGR
jgi:hypothetical protein